MYRITQINSSAGVGGGETHLLQLARHLHGREFHFDFLLPEEGLFCERLRSAGLPFQVIPMRTHFEWQARKSIAHWLKENRSDLLHCHGARSNWYGRAAARRARTPVVFSTAHNSLRNYPYPKWRRRLYVALENWNADRVDQWIAVSRSIRNDLIHYYRLPPDKIEVIPNGIDRDAVVVRKTRPAVRKELRIEEDAVVLIEVARMTEQKGHWFLLEAVARLRLDFPSLVCLLAGDGPERPGLEARCRRLGIAPSVRFLGFREDVIDLIHASDLYVLPSLSEGMPIGLLEAMASGAAVVATAVNGTSEVISQGENGLLVPPADPKSLEETIRQAIENPALRKRLAAGAVETVRARYSADRMAAQVRELYLKHLAS